MAFAILFEGALIIFAVFCWVCTVLKIGAKFPSDSVSELKMSNKGLLAVIAIASFGMIVLPSLCGLLLKGMLKDFTKIDVSICAILLSQVLFLPIIARIFFKCRSNKNGDNIILRTFHSQLFVGLYQFLLALPIVYLLAFIWVLLLLVLQSLGLKVSLEQQAILELFSVQSLALKCLLILSVVVIAPITEEILFRHVLYRFFKFKSTQSVAIFFSSLIFALLHFNFVAFIPIFALGFFLALSYERSGSLVAPIFTHMLFNLNTIIMLLSCGDSFGM